MHVILDVEINICNNAIVFYDIMFCCSWTDILDFLSTQIKYFCERNP